MRIRRLGGITILAAAAVMVAGGCGNDSRLATAKQNAVSGRLNQLEGLDIFRETPAFATTVGEDRRDECHEPEFERREPASWRELQFEGTPDEVLSYYRTRLTQDGWRLTREIANQGQLPTLQGTGNAAPGQGLAGSHICHAQAFFAAGIEHGLGQRVFAAAL